MITCAHGTHVEGKKWNKYNKNVSYEKNQTNEKDSDFKKHSFL